MQGGEISQGMWLIALLIVLLLLLAIAALVKYLFSRKSPR